MFGFFEGIYGFLIRQLGLRGDAADAAGSLHAKVKDAKDSISNKIGDSVDTRADNTVMGFASTQIKSIQRGTAQRTAGGAASINVAISSVDLSKSFVNHSTSCRTSASTPDQYLIRARLSSATNLVIEGFTAGNTDTDWEVIEFY